MVFTKKSIRTADSIQESFKFPRLSVNISAEIVSLHTTLDTDMETFFVEILNKFFTNVENTQIFMNSIFFSKNIP